MNLLKIFLEFLKIGSFSYGGGMATLPYIYEMASRTSWITEDYITKILTLSQITPGPLACNIGTIVGFKVSGIPGALVANIAFVIPAIIFSSICFKFVKEIKNNERAMEVIKVVRSAALAILITSSFSIIKKAFFNEFVIISFKDIFNIFNYKSILLAIIVFLLLRKKKINTFIMMAICAIVGGVLKI